MPSARLVFWLNFVLALLSWEAWMSYGIINGDSADARGALLPNGVNALMMATSDGAIALLQVRAVLRVRGAKAFHQWDWGAVGVMLAVGALINLFATVLLYKQLDGSTISLAPLMPFRTSALLQVQQPWLMQPFALYPCLLLGKSMTAISLTAPKPGSERSRRAATSRSGFLRVVFV
jgi:hypothetical protein